jgi:hypothetical protein
MPHSNIASPTFSHGSARHQAKYRLQGLNRMSRMTGLLPDSDALHIGVFFLTRRGSYARLHTFNSPIVPTSATSKHLYSTHWLETTSEWIQTIRNG